MRRLALLLFLMGMVTPALAVKRVTVDQLQQILAGMQGKRDEEAARRQEARQATNTTFMLRLLGSLKTSFELGGGDAASTAWHGSGSAA